MATIQWSLSIRSPDSDFTNALLLHCACVRLYTGARRRLCVACVGEMSTEAWFPECRRFVLRQVCVGDELCLLLLSAGNDVFSSDIIAYYVSQMEVNACYDTCMIDCLSARNDHSGNCVWVVFEMLSPLNCDRTLSVLMDITAILWRSPYRLQSNNRYSGHHIGCDNRHDCYQTDSDNRYNFTEMFKDKYLAKKTDEILNISLHATRFPEFMYSTRFLSTTVDVA